MRLRFIPHIVLAIAIVLIVVSVSPNRGLSFSNATLTFGSRGADVRELQSRLGYLGYYHGKIDGIFGTRTRTAVRSFQWRFGMKVDGIAGPKTKRMLVKVTKNWPGSASASWVGGFSSSEVTMLARAVFGEARGEPYIGQVAVAAVILNRVKSPLFPKTISGVIFQPGAFTAVGDGQIWLQPNGTAYKAARDAINGWDPSGGALYYFNPATATSSWIWSRPQIKRIGDHIFTK